MLSLVRVVTLSAAGLLLTGCGADLPTESAQAEAQAIALRFNPDAYQRQQLNIGDQILAVRAYERLLYVASPVEPNAERINIYIPDAYFRGESVGAYSAATAPIFLPNYVGGYMPSGPGSLSGRGMLGPPDRPNTIALALAHGYVVAAPGARGRTTQDVSGLYIGKAPAAIIDLKAAVRYLRFNDALMPGDAERIIANGTSAGGALAALLGASGNSADFQAALTALGAAPVRDDIFAVSAYCPITHLGLADAAYEWQFRGVRSYRRMVFTPGWFSGTRDSVTGTLNENEMALSAVLAAQFPEALNALALTDAEGRPLQLSTDGSGSFQDYIEQRITAAALTAGEAEGTKPWLRRDASGIHGVEMPAYIQALGRMKSPPAFDALDLSSGENQLFGSLDVDRRHFTDFSFAHSLAPTPLRADGKTVAMMDPLSYLGALDAKPARHWRIRHGTQDNDTALAIPAILALSLAKQGLAVDFALAWDQAHNGDYDLEPLFAWIDAIVKP